MLSCTYTSSHFLPVTDKCAFCCQDGGDLAEAEDSTIASGEKLKCTKRVVFQRVISNKGKRTLMATEMGQVNAVLAADSFKQDPFLAIQARILVENVFYACPVLMEHG